MSLPPFVNGKRVVPYFNGADVAYRVDFGRPGNGFDTLDRKVAEAARK